MKFNEFSNDDKILLIALNQADKQDIRRLLPKLIITFATTMCFLLLFISSLYIVLNANSYPYFVVIPSISYLFISTGIMIRSAWVKILVGENTTYNDVNVRENSMHANSRINTSDNSLLKFRTP